MFNMQNSLPNTGFGAPFPPQAAAGMPAQPQFGGFPGQASTMPNYGMSPPAPVADHFPQPPVLHVKVEGLSFQYQFTEDDVRKVFSRYGDVMQVEIINDGVAATVLFGQFPHAMAAWSDLNGKQLAGINGASLKVECPQLTNGGSTMNGAANGAVPNMYNGMSGAPVPGPDAQRAQGPPSINTNFDPNKKFTCRLEIGIENEKEYRVGSKVIQIARRIWEAMPAFQEAGGKTRLRGKGVGGRHESDEPLALCISCKEAQCFEDAVQFAETEITKIHQDYTRFCAERGWAMPNLKPVKAICDHPHTSAPWHAAKFDLHYKAQAVKKEQKFEQQRHIQHVTSSSAHHNTMSNHKKNRDGYALGEGPQGVNGGNSFAESAMYGCENPGQRPPNAPSDEDIWRMIEERNEARKGGQFEKADQIRDHLKSCGVVLMDDKRARGNMKGQDVTKWRFWNP